MTASSNTRKILYQLVSPLHLSAGPAEIARREALLRSWTSPAFQVDLASPETGPEVIESQIDVALAFPHLEAAARRWTADGYEAVVIGCFSDPAVDALRELTDSAVIGPGEAALLAAAQFADRFSVLSSEPSPSGLRRRIRAMGLGDRFVSERVVGASVAELRRTPEATFEGMVAAAKACLADGADILVLGCLSMCFAEDVPERLQKATGFPVINPVIAGLKSAEAALSYGIGRRPVRPAA